MATAHQLKKTDAMKQPIIIAPNELYNRQFCDLFRDVSPGLINFIDIIKSKAQRYLKWIEDLKYNKRKS